MNYYERIQKAIDHIEQNLDQELTLEAVGKAAFMSQTNLYRMFFAITGYSVKTYIRNRRFSQAAEELHLGKAILEVALKYGFESHEAFTRSFRKVVGMNPSSQKNNSTTYYFERKNIMEKYFDVQDESLLEKYPDIKVLKKLDPMRVAYYCYFGKEPEAGAWQVISDWLRKSGLKIETDRLRFFGFNNPSPLPSQTEYGYEIWVTISDDLQIEDQRIKVKSVDGGLYAVTSVKGGVEQIFQTWQRLNLWLLESSYTYGGHQWLEEHLDFDHDFGHLGGIDLYMPIEKKQEVTQSKNIMEVQPMKLSCMRFEGPNAIDEARIIFIQWINKKGIVKTGEVTRVIAWYNHECVGKNDHYCVIGIENNDDETEEDARLQKIEISGGAYAFEKCPFKRLGYEWGAFFKWVQNSKEYNFGTHQFFEVYLLEEGKLDMETEAHLYMPITVKE